MPDLRIQGGLPVGPDGRIHTVYRHDPSTLRLSAAAPNLTNIPRGSTPLQKLVRSFFEAGASGPDEMYEGIPRELWTLHARDFAGIEGVLTGFFANAARIVRLFKLDAHSYFTAYVMYELEKKIKFEDLPQESWTDADLKGALKAIKSRFKEERETNKKITHGANYMETAPMAQVILLNERGVLWPIKAIKKVMDFYHALFPEIGRWHHTLCAEVGGAPLKMPHQGWGFKTRNSVVTGPFGNTHRYHDVIEWEKTPKGWDWSFGPDAKRLASFLPQSTARFIKTRAAQRIWTQYPEVAKRYRLFIHDEIMLECPIAEVDHNDAILKQEMERPVPELVMPDGTLLAMLSESKTGRVWAEMK